MRAPLFIAVLCLGTIPAAHAQACPKQGPSGPLIDSAPQTLSGRIVFHDDLRQWFELKVDVPVCGEIAVQVIADQQYEPLGRAIQTMRGCKVTTHGRLGLPGTGYYSAAIYQDVDKIEAAPDCVRQAPFPDYSKLKPSPSLRIYRVSMWFDYTKPDSPLHATITDGVHAIQPWQPYASYMLTGGFVFYGYCADDFDLVSFSGTPEANPWLVDDYIALDPETAAQSTSTT
jgi:hypothetical protein